MSYSEKRKAYAREWYAKNKDRLLADPKRKASKKRRQKEYYKKNRERMLERARQSRLMDIEKYRAKRRAAYHKNKEKILAKRKDPKAMEAKKKYMKMYRQLNKSKLFAQNKERGRKWMKKQIDSLSDAYIITLLCNAKTGIFKTHAEAKKHPELIEARRTQLLLSRLKSKINKNDKARCTRDNKRYKNIGRRE